MLALELPEQATAHLHFEAVAEGCYVTLELSRGERFDIGIGVPLSPFDVARYSATSEEVRALLGKRLGDVVTWTTGPAGPVEASIKEISHPYRYAVGRLLSAVQRFPGKSPISAVEVGEKLEGAKRILAEQQQDQDDFLEFARNRPVTLALMAKRLGRDLYRLWSSLEAIPFKVLVSTNTKSDVDSETAALEEAKGVVLDPLALLDLKALGLLDRLAARFPTLLVPQASVDVLNECRDSILADRERGDLLTVAVHGGELSPTVITQLQLDQAAAFLGEIRTFCNVQCTRVGRPRPLSDREKELAKAVTEPFIVPMMVAGDRDAAGVRLLSDEAICRAVGREVCGARAFSAVTFVGSELDRGFMTLDEYSDAMRFFLRRMRHVTLTVGYLTHLVVTSRPVSEYALAVDALLAPELQRDPALRVAVAHIRQAAIEAPFWEGAAGYLQMLLMRIARRHGKVALMAMRKVLDSPSLIVVPNVERAVRLIELCERARLDTDSLLP